MQSPKGSHFINVILIDLAKGEIFWKDIEESMGPTYYKCPKEMFKFIKPPNDYAKNWREKCITNNAIMNRIKL